jgi:hypothetical protein
MRLQFDSIIQLCLHQVQEQMTLLPNEASHYWSRRKGALAHQP